METPEPEGAWLPAGSGCAAAAGIEGCCHSPGPGNDGLAQNELRGAGVSWCGCSQESSGPRLLCVWME